MKININGHYKTLTQIIKDFNLVGHRLSYKSAKVAKARSKKKAEELGGNFTEWKYKFLLFEKVFDKWYCKII